MITATRLPLPTAIIILGIVVAVAASSQSSPLAPAQVVFDSLTLPREIAVSPGGEHIYVAAGDTIVAYQRNNANGSLTAVDTQRDSVDGVEGLALIRSLAVSPDGAHLYGAATTDDAVSVFARDGISGTLSFVGAKFDGIGGVSGISSANAVTVAPDGAHVYVAGRGSAAVAVFSRNQTSGDLTFVEAATNGVNGVDGLAGAESVAVSLDGRHVYAAGANDNALAVFSRSAATGALTFVEVERDGVNGVNGLAGNWYVAISPDDAHVYAAGSGDNALAVFARNALSGALTFVQNVTNGVNGVDGLLSVESVAVSADGVHVYAAGQGDDAIAVFARNAVTGELTFVEVVRDGVNGVTGMGEPRFAMVTPDGEHVYAVSFGDDGLAIFSRSDVTGALSFVDEVQSGLGGIDGLGSVAAVSIAPDGRHVYAAGYDDDGLAAFTRDPSSGELTFVESFRDDVNGVDGLSGAAVVSLAPDGAHLYAAGRLEPKIAVFSRNDVTGTLTYVETLENGVNGVSGLNDTTSITVSPDGAHVYSTGHADNAIAVFARNALTGALTFVEVQQDGAAGVDGLAGAAWTALSPDGAHLYAAGLNDNAVAVFERNIGTGALTFLEFLQDGAAGVDGLTSARHVAVSPDGTGVFISGLGDDGLAVFSRDGISGSLTFVKALKKGVDGVEGLGGVSSVVVTPGGDWLFAAGYTESAVAAFSRDVASGEIRFEAVVRDDENGFVGLGEPQAIVIAPDAGFLYTASEGDHALSVVRKLVVASIEGYVESSIGGEGLSCAVIELTAADLSATYRAYSDANGYYFFDAIDPGQYTVSAFGPGFNRSTAQAVLLEAGSTLAFDIVLSPGSDEQNVTGTVIDADTGYPLTGVRVEAIVNGQVIDTTYTCASGAFAFSLPAAKGASSIQLHFSLDYYFSETADVTLEPGEAVIVNQSLQKQLTLPGTLAGVVYGPEGAKQDVPLAGVRVTAVGGSANASVVTNTNGLFLFDNLLPGSYTLRASKEGFLGATDQRFVAAGAVVQSVLRLNDIPPPPPGALRVQIEPAGARTAGAKWRVNAGPEQESGVTVHGLGPGTATISFSQLTGWTAPATFETNIASGETRLLTRFYSRRYDVNGDYEINAVDVQLVINGALGLPVNAAADIDGSGGIDAIDIQTVINAVLGI